MSTAILTNAFKEIFEALADKFSGEDFTKEDLMKEFLGNDLTSKVKKKGKKKNGKKMTKSGKPHKMTIRKYIMQDAEWKAKINEKKDEITKTNKEEYDELVDDADDDEDAIKEIEKPKKGNFIICTSLVIGEMDDDVKEELQEKVDAVNEKNASDAESSTGSDSD